MIRVALVLAVSAMMAGGACAQPAAGDPAWPTRPVRLIAPFPPASTVDVVSRFLGQKLSARLGRQLPLVAHRARQPPAQRPGPEHGEIGHGSCCWPVLER